MSKTLFVNGLSSDSVINIQLIDINQIPLGIIRSGDHLNVTAPVKYINIAFRNHHPRLHSFTVHHHVCRLNFVFIDGYFFCCRSQID